MKKTLSMLAIMSAVLVSCTKSEINQEGDNPKESYLNVYYDDIVFPSNGGEDYFDIESNTDWTISNTSDWLTIKPMEGNGNASITLTAIASDVYDDRNTVITVKAGDKTETFTVTQKYAEALLVTKNKLDIPQEGGDFTIEIQSNISYEIQIDSDSQSWISEAPKSKALTTYTHTFSVESNPNTTKRDGSVKIIGSNGKTETVNIYQAQKDELVLSKSEETVPAKGGEVRVQLRSNVDYEVIMPENTDWVEQIQSDKADELIFNVKPNDKTEDRKAEITVKDKNSDLSQTFTIKQIVGSIMLEESYFEVGGKGGIVEIKLSADIEVEVVIPDDIDWITLIETKALEKRTLQLDVQPNSGIEERTAQIAVKDINSPISQSIEIKQMPYGYYIGDISAETEEDLIEIRDAGYKVIDGNAYFNVATLSKLENLIEEITGDLTIGSNVTSLDGLYGLKDVGGDLLENSLKLVSFEGLNNLKSIQGNFTTSGVSFKSLTSLETIGGDFTVSSVESFEGLENLNSINGCLTIDEATSCKGLTKINTLLELNTCWITSYEGLDNLNTIQGNFTVKNGWMTNFKGLGNLTNIGGKFILIADKTGNYESLCNNLVNFEGLDNLQNIGSDFIIESNAYGGYAFNSLKSFKGLDNLTIINGNFIINSSASTVYWTSENYGVGYSLVTLESFDGLTNLSEIGGNFEIHSTASSSNAKVGYSLSGLKSLKGLDNLMKIDGNFIISASGNVKNFTSLTFNDGPVNLITINGDFIINSNMDNGEKSYTTISSMSGFSGLETISGNLAIDDIKSFSGFDRLCSIGKDFTISSGDTQGMSNLATIGGNLTVNGETSSINGLTGLNTINGNLSISETSMTSINGVTQLQKVGGDIEISDNNELEDISGFSGLTNCTNISITDSPNLYNFESLETAAKNMTGTWYVYGCGYNPTKYQMLNGESKPQE